MKNQLILLAALAPFALSAAEIHAFGMRPATHGDLDGAAWKIVVDGTHGAEIRLDGPDGKTVAGPFASHVFTAGGVRPWSDETPFLYTLSINDADGGQSVPFAFRTFSDNGGKPVLNGREIRFKAAAIDEALEAGKKAEEIVEEAKLSNCNAIDARDVPEELFDAFAAACARRGVYLVAPAKNGARAGVTHAAVLHWNGKLDKLQPSPAAAFAYRDFTVKATNYFSRLSIANNRVFANAKNVRLEWTALRDGEKAASGTIDLHSLAPGAELAADMPESVERLRMEGGSISLRFAFLEDGREIAIDQIDIVESRAPEPFSEPPPHSLFGGPSFAVSDEDGLFAVSIGKTRFAFSRRMGMPVSISMKKFFGRRELLAHPFIPSIRGKAFKIEDCDWTGLSEDGNTLSFTTLSTWRSVDDSRAVDVYAKWTVSKTGNLACAMEASHDFEEDWPEDWFALDTGVAGGDMPVEWFGRGGWRLGHPPFTGRWETPAEVFARGGEPVLIEEVRGLRRGFSTLRTLAAPMPVSVGPGGTIALHPQSSRGETCFLSFTFEPGEKNLSPRMK